MSVVIVSYRTPDLTVAACRSSADAGVSEVIVVDNASGDGTIAALRDLKGINLTIVESPENVGFGRAANQGARVSTARIVCFLNSDAALGTHAATTLFDAVAGHGGRCIAAPRLLNVDRSVQPSAGLLPAPGNLAIQALGGRRLADAASTWPILRNIISASGVAHEYSSARDAESRIETNMVSGACFAIGREAFSELGGFDERFFLYFEDADLCRRARHAGMAIRYLPDATVTHIGGASSPESYRFGPRHARSMRQYLGKWYGPPGVALAVLLMLVRAIGLSLMAPRRSGRAWRAWGATLGFGGA